jgi:hypothetical protein
MRSGGAFGGAGHATNGNKSRRTLLSGISHSSLSISGGLATVEHLAEQVRASTMLGA